MARWHVWLLGIILTQIWGADCEDQHENTKYDNHTLVRLIPKNDVQFEVLRNFQESDIEIMKLSHGLNDSLDLLVPQNRMDYVNEYAASNKILLDVKQKNYGRSFATEREPKRRFFDGFNIFQYNSDAAIQDYLESISRRHSNLITLQPLGKSYEGRKMTLVKISSHPGSHNPVIFIDAGIHAREWVAPAMALYIIHRLVDPEGRKELNGVDWYILPLVNPDGYEYTRSSSAHRLWRKTRSRTSGNCFGVDGNRNYGFHWAESGISKNPCDNETYAGSQPFSEPETRKVKSVMYENADRIKLYVSLHAYGNYLVYPWGYTGNFLPKEWRKLDSLARKVSNSVQAAGGQPLSVMSAGKWYAAAGGSDDYAFGAVGVPYSYTFELTNGYEFEFPKFLLRETLPKFYEGFKTFGTEIKREFGKIRLKRQSECVLSRE